MSVTLTKRVNLPPPTPHINQSATRYGKEFIEVVDTNNNVSVRSDTHSDHSEQGGNSFAQSGKQEPEVKLNSPTVNSTIEALAASGVYEQENIEDHSQVNIYSTNQSIIKDEELERTGHNYLKHFYEKNEPVSEVNKLI